MPSKPTNLQFALVALVAALVAAPAAYSISPAGDPVSIEVEVRERLDAALDQIYEPQYTPFDIRLRTFLWDSRGVFDVSLVPDDKLVDAAVCLLVQYYMVDDLSEYADFAQFRVWCDRLLQGI